jgi:PAS domain S-box-containing protein
MTAQLGYHNAWIALVDNISQKVTEVAASNIGDSFKELEKNLKGGVFTCKMQEALLENRLILVKDPDKECPDCPLADKYSNRSGMTRRLEFEGQVFGVVSVSVPKEYALDIEEQNLFSELVRDLAFGLYKIQAEVQLERIKKVIRTIPSPMSFLDSEYRYLAVNNSYSQFFSVASKEIIGRKPQDFMGEEIFNQEIKPHLDRALAGESVRYEVEVDFPGKGRRFMEMVYMPFREKNGEVVGIISHGTDITDLKISEKQLSKVINNTPVGICVTDENGYFIKVNPAYCRLYNYKESELLGKHFTIVVPEEHKKELNQLHRDFIAGGMELRGEWQVVDKNGKEISIIADATAIKDMLGRPQKVTFVMDITERKELEQLKEDVDRIMRHDLKQPLNAIIGMPQILEMDDNLTEEQLVNLGYIKTAGKNMLHMIDSTLDLFKMETGKYNYQPRMVDLVRAVWQLLDQNQTIMNAKELTFGFTIDNHEVKQGDSYKIWSEERLLYSLLSNLFINALEASPYNEKVVIRVLEADQIVVSIENKGAIPEQVREHFFEKYKTYGKKRGTGLGTYSAYLIATTMHYKLEAETSDQEDRTSISVFIPKEAPIVKQDQSEN